MAWPPTHHPVSTTGAVDFFPCCICSPVLIPLLTVAIRFALDLIEVFFQIVHTRLPLLNPVQFRQQLRLQPQSSHEHLHQELGPPHPALLATVIAWGTKFSEHSLLVADRRSSNGQSLMAKAMVDRARDLAEALKVHRIPTHDHVVIGLLLEPLQSRASFSFRPGKLMTHGLMEHPFQKIRMIQVVGLLSDTHALD
jgi:hypothetical protein